MSQKLRVIRSLPVTDAVLTATSVAENDHPAWASATNYPLGEYVIHGHSVYEAVAESGNQGQVPTSSPNHWALVGPTNRWRAFDLSSTTQTEFEGGCHFEFTPGRGISGVVLLNLVGVATVRIRLTDPDYGVVYDETVLMTSTPSAADWWSWTFEMRVARTELIANDLPSYPNATLRIDLSAAPGITGRVGVIAFGPQRELGLGIRRGAQISLLDFSRKERNEQGDTYLRQGAYAKELTLQFPIANADLDNVYGLFAELRAIPCLWTAFDAWRSTTVWGFYREFSVDITYETRSECSLVIEGLT